MKLWVLVWPCADFDLIDIIGGRSLASSFNLTIAVPAAATELTVVAETDGDVGEVRFSINGKLVRIEKVAPHACFGV